jgi:hypothetical protein
MVKAQVMKKQRRGALIDAIDRETTFLRIKMVICEKRGGTYIR